MMGNINLQSRKVVYFKKNHFISCIAYNELEEKSKLRSMRQLLATSAVGIINYISLRVIPLNVSLFPESQCDGPVAQGIVTETSE